MTTKELALAEAKVLKGFLEAQGVTVSIELMPGTRKAYGWLVPPGQFRVEMSHHIVSARHMGLTPFLALVKKGRPDVIGPLCNGYMGFDGVYRIITMGVANHPGAGGPMLAGEFIIAKDTAAYYSWGTEYEGGLNPEDWTPFFKAKMAAANAGIIDYLHHRNPKVTDACHAEHSTWAPGRKGDRLHYTRGMGIQEIKAHRAGFVIGEAYTVEYIKEIQRLLNLVMGTSLREDGDLGPLTISVVKDYQESAGLFVDGDPGPITLKSLWLAALAEDDDMATFIKGNASTAVYLLTGTYKVHIANPAILNALRDAYGTKDTKTLAQEVIDVIPTLPAPLSLEAVKVAVGDAVKALPGGIDAGQVADMVVQRLADRLSA